jgi:hypothetical protein
MGIYQASRQWRSEACVTVRENRELQLYVRQSLTAGVRQAYFFSSGSKLLRTRGKICVPNNVLIIIIIFFIIIILVVVFYC